MTMKGILLWLIGADPGDYLLSLPHSVKSRLVADCAKGASGAS